MPLPIDEDEDAELETRLVELKCEDDVKFASLPDEVKVVPPSLQALADRLLTRFQNGFVGNVAEVSIQVTNVKGCLVEKLNVRYREDLRRWNLTALVGVEKQVIMGNGYTIQIAWALFLSDWHDTGFDKRCGNLYRGEACTGCGIRDHLIPFKECDICHEDTKDHYQLLCGHSYGKDCLKKWVAKTCPACRRGYTLNPGWMEKKNKKRRREECNNCGYEHEHANADEDDE